MYESFVAVVKKGKIEPVGRVKLRNATKLLVTIVEDPDQEYQEWARLRDWVAKQKKTKRASSYTSVTDAKRHLRRLMKS